MFLVFGQFYNQTTATWQWQQVGGSAITSEEAEQFAHGFARNYGFAAKIVTRNGTRLYLPPVLDESALKDAQAQ
jgi:hypothetical protein